MTNAELMRTAGQGSQVDGSKQASEDMRERADDQARWPLLQDELERCRRTMIQLYDASDEAALLHQVRQHWLVFISASFGGLAVLTAIVRMAVASAAGTARPAPAFDWLDLLLLGLEVTFVLIAIVAFSWGEHERKAWFRERHKAERYRLAKFDFLTNPSLWCGGRTDVETCRDRLRMEVKRISDLKDNDEVHAWANEDRVPEMPAWPIGNRLPAQDLRQVKDYYLKQRLHSQSDYFKIQSGRIEHHWLRWLRKAPLGLFWCSVMVVLVEVTSEVLRNNKHWVNALALIERLLALLIAYARINWHVVLIAFAVALPAIGSAVRAYLTAHEPERNMIRFRAKYIALDRLAKRITTEMDAEQIFQDMWCCEQIMNSEHREWLRLMMEAEWFG